MAALQLERTLGWVPVPAFPAPGMPQEMHFKMMHFTTTSSKDTFLTHCPPRKELCDPWKFLGEQTLTHLLLSHYLPDPRVPPSTEQLQPLAETWIVFAFPFWGFASCPGHVTIPEKACFSVLSCSFVLA